MTSVPRPKTAGARLGGSDVLPRSRQSQTLDIRNKKINNVLQGVIHQLETEKEYSDKQWGLQMRILTLRYKHLLDLPDPGGKKSIKVKLTRASSGSAQERSSRATFVQDAASESGRVSVSGLSNRTAWIHRPSLSMSPHHSRASSPRRAGTRAHHSSQSAYLPGKPSSSAIDVGWQREGETAGSQLAARREGETTGSQLPVRREGEPTGSQLAARREGETTGSQLAVRRVSLTPSLPVLDSARPLSRASTTPRGRTPHPATTQVKCTLTRTSSDPTAKAEQPVQARGFHNTPKTLRWSLDL